MEKDKNIVDSFALFMEQNIRGIQYGLYSTAIVGLAVALRSVRPFKKFTTPTSIPASFMSKHIKLRGRVVAVEPSGLLAVDHFPIWPMPHQDKRPLPVQIDSVQILGLGTAWLQTVVNGQNINFQPIATQKDAVSCIVIKNKKNVGIQLVSLGLASVQPFHIHLRDDELYKMYYKELLTAENQAESQRLGVWADGSSRPRPTSTIALDAARKVFGALNGAVRRIRNMSSLSAVPR